MILELRLLFEDLYRGQKGQHWGTGLTIPGNGTTVARQETGKRGVSAIKTSV